MSKTKTVVENIEIDVKPIPTGNISLKEFINSEPGRLSFIQFKDENFSDIEKFIGFLCNYQACEIASALVKAGKPFASTIGVDCARTPADAQHTLAIQIPIRQRCKQIILTAQGFDGFFCMTSKFPQSSELAGKCFKLLSGFLPLALGISQTLLQGLTSR